MLEFIKTLIGKYRSVFEETGGEASRETFTGELNYESGKFFYMVFLALILWPTYIPSDMALHPRPVLAVLVSVGFSLLALCMILLRLTRRFRYHADTTLTVLIAYFCFSKALNTAPAGDAIGLYMGGYMVSIIFIVFIPFLLKVKVMITVVSLLIFFSVGIAVNLDFSLLTVEYVTVDLLVWSSVGILLMCSQNDFRYKTWKMRQDLKNALSQNENHITEISKLAVEAEASSKAKSEFLSKMSHELRTPMNSIIGMAELALREDNLPKSAREHILTINQSSVSLLAIINNILDFSKIESGDLKLNPAEYSLVSLVNDVASIIRMKMPDSGLHFTINIDCNLPDALYGDNVRIRQVLLNVLNNAFKYTEKGYVVFTVSGETGEDGVLLLRMEIADSGRGIKKDDIEKLFGEFVQLDLENSNDITGAGLGLTIAWNLVKKMNGSIDVTSGYGEGSTFVIIIPQKIMSHKKLAAVENPEEKSVLVYERRVNYIEAITSTLGSLGVDFTTVSSDSELLRELKNRCYAFLFISSFLYGSVKPVAEKLGVSSRIVLLADGCEAVPDRDAAILTLPIYSLSIAHVLNDAPECFTSNKTTSKPAISFIAPGAKVLIVDDIATNLKVTEGLLIPYKMQIDTSLSGLDAIEKIQANRYDLVFMDHMMPELNGIEAVSRIRSLDSPDLYYQSVPIVALTANAVIGAKGMFLDNGFDDFISKPIDTLKLNLILEKWLPEALWMAPFTDEDIACDNYFEDGMVSIYGVDVKKGVGMTGGDLEHYMQTLQTFYDDGIDKIKELTLSLENENLDLYIVHVHALKSACSIVGADRLSDMAMELEAAGNLGDFDLVKSHTSVLFGELDAVLHSINAALEKERAKNISPVALEPLKAELYTLMDAIENFDISAINKSAKVLMEFNRAPVIGEAVKKILHKKLMGEYEDLKGMIDALLLELGQYPPGY